MAHVGSQFAPLGGGGAIGKLYQVECIVYVRLQVVKAHVGVLVIVFVLELAGQSATQYGQRFGSDFFREQEKLVESQSVGLVVVGVETVGECVVPAVFVEGTVFHRAHRVFPLIARGQIGALHDATAGEAEDARMQVFEVFHEVGAQSVPVVFGEERHVVKVNALVGHQEYAHQPLGIGLVGSECGGVFLPFVVGHGDSVAGDGYVVRTDKFHAEAGRAPLQVGDAGIDGEVVVHTFFQAHAEEAAVFQTRHLLRVPRTPQRHIVRVALEGRFLVGHTHVSESIPAHQPVRELKRAVFHHLGVEAAIGPEIDVFKEYAIHRRLYGAARTGIYRKPVLG